MNAQPKKTYILTDRHAEAVERLIESGAAESFDQVVAAGIEAVSTASIPPLEDWTERALAESLDELERDPDSAIPADRAWAEVQADIAARRAKG